VRTRDGDPRRTDRAIFRLDRRDPHGKARDRSARGCCRQAQSAEAAARIVAEMLARNGRMRLSRLSASATATRVLSEGGLYHRYERRAAWAVVATEEADPFRCGEPYLFTTVSLGCNGAHMHGAEVAAATNVLFD